MIFLTIFAITTARLVYGVQQQAADLNNKERDKRIETLAEFGDRLKEQQNRLTEEMHTSDAREKDRITKTADLYMKEMHQVEATMRHDKLIGSLSTNSTDMLDVMHSLNASVISNMNRSLSLLAMLQMKKSFYTPEEQALIKNIIDTTKAQSEQIAALDRHFKDSKESFRRLREEYDKSLLNAPKEQHAALQAEYERKTALETQRLQLQGAKEMAQSTEKMKKLDEAGNAMKAKMDK